MAPKVRRGALRPAASPRGLRRPAARGDGDQVNAEGEAVKRRLRDLDPRNLLKVGAVCLEEATYYGKTCPIAGHFKSFRSEEEEIFLELEATGTKHEEMLRWLSGRPDRRVTVHVCQEGCHGKLTDEFLIHAEAFEAVDLRDYPGSAICRVSGKWSKAKMKWPYYELNRRGCRRIYLTKRRRSLRKTRGGAMRRTVKRGERRNLPEEMKRS